MGLFNFFNRLDTKTNDGLNLIHHQDTKNLLYTFNKRNGKIEGLLQVFRSVASSGQNPNYTKTNVGLVHQEYFFINGLPNGYFKEYDFKGNLKIHSESIKSVDFLFFNKVFYSEKLKTYLLFTKEYKINGFLKIFDKNGNLESEEQYKKNELINRKMFFSNGQLKYDSNEGKKYYENGQLKSDIKEGKEYYENGNIKIDVPSGKRYFIFNDFNIHFFEYTSCFFSFEDFLFSRPRKIDWKIEREKKYFDLFKYFEEIYFYDENGVLICNDKIIEKYVKNQ
jgi:antitoxin component YwqK of YwqJK toxin-antitoxin module